MQKGWDPKEHLPGCRAWDIEALQEKRRRGASRPQKDGREKFRAEGPETAKSGVTVLALPEGVSHTFKVFDLLEKVEGRYGERCV